MPKILAVLCSGRKKGYTAGLLYEAINGIKEVSDQIDVDLLYLHDYK